ncbi:MAG TPA: hypothetical protein PLL32_01135 [Anaeromyxobacteraceae bacterium]|nr:hypothetical protein [Anaeromyxobacteraceae bacterium]
MSRFLLAAPLALLLAACSAPSTTVRTVDTRPAIAILDAAPGAILVLDGRVVGPAAAYTGSPNVLRLEPGTHEVEIRDPSGVTTFRQTIFVESEIKTIRVH